MEKIMNTLQIVNGCTWRDAIENADLLNLNLTYDYDKDGSGYISVEDYPSSKVHLGRCYSPNEREYDYDVILLGTYNGWNDWITDEFGQEVTEFWASQVGFALFVNNNGITKLVKADDTINSQGEYYWDCVMTGLGE